MTTKGFVKNWSHGWLPLLLLPFAALAQQTLRAGLWEPATIALQSSATYDNPYLDVQLTATFNGPQGEEIVLAGFWDGGRDWKIRFAPVRAGMWRYRTVSNDPGLQTQGQLQCVPSDLHGPVIVNPARPTTFVHADGTPFFWMGETSWRLLGPGNFTSRNNSPVDTTFETFRKYVDRRAAQHFNHIHCVVDGNTNEGGPTFLDNDKNRLNPGFFQGIDRRLDYMLQKGVGVELVLTWAQQFVEYTRPQFENYARYLIARYAAYPVLFWNLSGEFQEAGKPEDYAYFGRLIKNLDPYGHPITIHPTGNRTNSELAAEPWNSVVMQQRFEEDHTIALADLLQQLGRTEVPVLANVPTTEIDVPDRIHQQILDERRYNKPVVNAEFGYEQYDGRTGRINRTTPEAVRKLAWGIVTAGGYFCYGMEATYREFFNLPERELGGSETMHYLYELMASTDFSNLAPHDELVSSPAMCLANPGKEYVVYLPTGGELAIDLVPGQYQATWFNPRTGVRSPGATLAGGTRASLPAQDNRDWVLYLKKTASLGYSQILLTPAVVQLPREMSWKFEATAIAASGDTVEVQPIWSASAGSIDTSGLYTAPNEDGSFQVRATVGAISAVTTVEVAGRLYAEQTVNRGFVLQNDIGGWHGTYVCDYDGDGDEDLFMTSHGLGKINDTGKNTLWRNRGNGFFEEVAVTAGVDGGLHGRFSRELHGASWIDYDNDGDFDLFLANTDADADDDRWHAVDELFRNNGDGTFTRLENIGLSQEDFNRRGACVGDFDGNGWLDLFVVSMLYWRGRKHELPQPYRALYLNNGDGRFTLATKGIHWVSWSEGCTTLDFDSDGDVDILEAGDGPESGLHLWRNRGNGQFELAVGTGLPEDGGFNGAVVAADFNNDGAVEIFAVRQEGNPASERGRIYLNNRDGSFTPAQEVGGAEHMIPADIDNDGDLDLISNGVFINDGNANFRRLNAGIIPAGRGGMAFDADNDGDLDLILNRSDREAPYLNFYENNLHVGNWLRIKLTNPYGAAGAPGAKVWVYAAGHLNEPEHLLGYREVVSALGFTSGPSPVQHFGLRNHQHVDVRVEFPGGQTVNRLDVAAGRTLLISALTVNTNGRAPIAVATANVTTGCAPLMVHFDASESQPVEGKIVSYQWEFGDGTTSSVPNPIHTYDFPGEYTATLHVRNDSGEAARASLRVSVLSADLPALEVALESPAEYRMRDSLGAGDRYYVDRDFRILNMPGALTNSRFVLTANDDKSRNEESWLRLRVNRPVRVYVAYDHRATSLPNWLREFESSAMRIPVSDTSASPLLVFAKNFPAGEIVLGGNLAAGAGTARSNYIVAVQAIECSEFGSNSSSGPETFSLEQSYPNPFAMSANAEESTSVRILYRLFEDTRVHLAIYDILGRLVTTIVDEEQPAGSHIAEWNGRDDLDHAVGTGLYFYRIQSGKNTATRRLLVLAKQK